MGRLAKVIPASYSSLSSFETCPRKHYLTRVAKVVTEPQGEALVWGNAVHAALEKHLKDGTALPPTMKSFMPLVDKLLSKVDGMVVLVEQELCVDANFDPCGWWDKQGWFRGKVDAAFIAGDTAFVVDWKTGKVKNDPDQLALFAALIFAHHPSVNTVKSAFAWLQERKLSTATFSREQVGELWGALVPRVDHLKQAKDDDKWPPRPSGLCRKWCPVGKRHCEYCGE